VDCGAAKDWKGVAMAAMLQAAMDKAIPSEQAEVVRHIKI
jgi:hypothetical protein